MYRTGKGAGKEIRQLLGGKAAVFSEAAEGSPVRRAQGGPAGERRHVDLALFPDEAVEIGELIVGAVGNGFEAKEGEATVAGDAGDGCGFHIDESGLVFFGEGALFFLTGNVVEGDEYLAQPLAFFRGGGEALAGCVVDDFADLDGFGRPESAGKGTGPADGDEGVDAAGGKDVLDSAGHGSGAHAGARGSHLDGADVAAEGVVVTAPVLDERFEFAGKSSDDADAVHLGIA